jgi:tetratricopeptide (TPR) repeat protein
MTMRRAGEAVCVFLLIVLCTLVFVSGCSLFVTKDGIDGFWERQMNQAKTIRGEFEPIPEGGAGSHYSLGCYYQRLGRHEEAIRELEKAIGEKPDFVEARNRLGLSYGNLGRLEMAEEVYLAALDIEPGKASLHNNLGYSYLLQGKWDAAVGAFKQAVELNGSKVDSRMYNNLGLAYAMAERYEDAMAVFEKVFGEAEAHYRMARIYSRLGMAEEAKQHYIFAAGFDPSSPVYGKAVEELERRQELADFIDDVKEAVETAGSAETRRERERLIATPGIEISNGNGVFRMARRVGRFLKARGFTIVRLTNAKSFSCPETVIQYRGEYEMASVELARVMPEPPRITEVERLDRRNVKIKMLLGKDIVRDRRVFAKGE